ncbi:unnamed protein product [Prorocentrum cordatum]|uniref:40S ribosomal protein S15 n=1 Tax=Prorocentrum cordatum TaxID=2364126 RepID=A0ABN9TZ69_9DINO|nr:unnamed protein product [Polarella glacialis]
MGDDDQKKKRTFKKYSFRGIDLDKLLDLSNQDFELMELFRARQRRKFSRGIKRKPIALLKKLRKAKRETAYGEKPEAVKTHLRNMVIVPEMIGPKRGGRLQRQAVHQRGGQAGGHRPLPGGVLHHVQAHQTRPRWHGGQDELHPAEVSTQRRADAHAHPSPPRGRPSDAVAGAVEVQTLEGRSLEAGSRRPTRARLSAAAARGRPRQLLGTLPGATHAVKSFRMMGSTASGDRRRRSWRAS